MLNYKILKDKKIVEILNGDIAVGNIQLNGKTKELRMPYLTKNRICEIADKFDIKLDTNLCRWELTYSLIDKGVEKNNIENIINFLFNKLNFDPFDYNSKEEFNFIYEKTRHKVLDAINMQLEIANVKLVSNGNTVYMIPSNNFEPYPFQIKRLKQTYIYDLYKNLITKIKRNDFDSAVTEARTLLEEVMIKLVEDKGEKNESKGNIRKLYKQVKKLYSMSTNNELDIRIKTLLSGLESIVGSIAEMRNNYSDSHGVGFSRIRIKERHAILVVNSALTMSEFLLSVENED